MVDLAVAAVEVARHPVGGVDRILAALWHVAHPPRVPRDANLPARDLAVDRARGAAGVRERAADVAVVAFAPRAERDRPSEPSAGTPMARGCVRRAAAAPRRQTRAGQVLAVDAVAVGVTRVLR